MLICIIELMFDTTSAFQDRAGEPTSDLPDAWGDFSDADFDDLVYRLTQEAALRTETDHGLPRELETLPPIALAALISRIDPNELSGHDQVRILQARERLVSHHQAGSIDAVDAITHYLPPADEHDPLEVDQRWEYASDEVRAALRLTRYGAEQKVDLAISLVDDHNEHFVELKIR